MNFYFILKTKLFKWTSNSLIYTNHRKGWTLAQIINHIKWIFMQQSFIWVFQQMDTQMKIAVGFFFILHNLHIETLTFASKLSIMFAWTLVTTHNTFDILIFNITDLSSIGATYWWWAWCCGVVIIGGAVIIVVVIVVIIIIIRTQWSVVIMRLWMHSIRWWVLLHRQHFTFRRCRLWQKQFTFGLSLREQRRWWCQGREIIIGRNWSDIIR